MNEILILLVPIPLLLWMLIASIRRIIKTHPRHTYSHYNAPQPSNKDADRFLKQHLKELNRTHRLQQKWKEERHTFGPLDRRHNFNYWLQHK